MFWLDWIIVFVPLIVVIWIGLKSQKYVRGVSDFLAAGRCAGRYVLAVAGGEAAMGLISVVALVERDYNAGFAFGFWNRINTPLTLLFGLTGYCVYRFRETRAMTMGQFLEMRYSRGFRVLAAILQSASGIINYAIFPAVSARFLVYFLGLPAQLHFWGMTLATHGVLMVAFLGLALAIILSGGQVTIMVTDCVQGILSYPMYVVIVGYILYRFSWGEEMAPTLLNRVPGESFMNPYDISKLRDFNLVYVIIGMVSSVLNRMSWGSSMGYSAAARNAHEQKIGGLLGTWRAGLSTMMFTLLSVAALTYLNHRNFAVEALKVRTQLAQKVVEDVAAAPEYALARAKLHQDFAAMKPVVRGREKPLSNSNNLETVYYATARNELSSIPGGKATAQNFRTIYGQMLVPLALREIFPMGITGIFCALMIFLLVSTDTTYMHTWGSIVLQDIILPLRKKPYTPKEQLKMLRICITGVCLFAFFFSLFFAQMDYIMMFFEITGAIWMGGAGPVIVFGLYSKHGTTAGAYAALISGAFIAVSGFVMQNIWVEHLYPWFAKAGLVPMLDTMLRTASKPFGTYVQWSMTPYKFPINSMEIFFIAMVVSVLLYVFFSMLTAKKQPFNLEKMLHRGQYAVEGEGGYVCEKWTFRNAFSKIIGITNEYTTGDKVLAWSVFLYSFGYLFGILFLLPVLWNLFYSWPANWWGTYFFISNFWVVGLIGIVTTFWFTIGGIVDLRQLFVDLAKEKQDIRDDGRVEDQEEPMDPEVDPEK